jgi:hypothetical protein
LGSGASPFIFFFLEFEREGMDGPVTHLIAALIVGLVLAWMADGRRRG